jgi:hypothetical protein
MAPLLIFAVILAIVLGTGHGIVGAVVGFAAGVLIYFAVGAIVTMGRRLYGNRSRKLPPEVLLVPFECPGCISKEISHYSELICTRGFNECS